jgi:hypothetical protein
VLLPQTRQQLPYRLAPGLSENVADEEDAH